ncbi:nitrile hydratase subunit alpha [Neoroseomonas oryzicola]|uniref:Nitrile hydratase subunit alpha n=1 Tax=Neoroseomonas oryzicola TaxID=535904 RepID=A0A9X9WQM5_9PROT|nr:nitrile hydratase subunit alpha [Neoroseomonas oryzicola]MBR0662635.1 nitrile hydratase subunit alpha [Neoroseomonas oryzicola]NKE19286.1 nitrile hydratase subunit alpha [Neoroseomonas oryzicola]
MAAPPRPESLALLDRLMAALEAKGIVTEAEIAERQANTDKASPETGARMVAKAWTDPAYRQLLLTDGKAAAEAMGVSMAGAPPLGVLENTPTRHHLVVCTLCSCYPRAVLGYPPNWYKSFAYRSRAVREPRAVLAEWGLNLPDSVEVRVVDSTADYRWMVLPMRPAGTEGWDEARLASLVTRDALVGVAVAKPA